jgi:hypothetical protein
MLNKSKRIEKHLFLIKKKKKNVKKIITEALEKKIFEKIFFIVCLIEAREFKKIFFFSLLNHYRSFGKKKNGKLHLLP